jgi:hypothetical protein
MVLPAPHIFFIKSELKLSKSIINNDIIRIIQDALVTQCSAVPFDKKNGGRIVWGEKLFDRIS